jgi:TRAP-type C4-dicarboxylate transport system substrate-binding protein
MSGGRLDIELYTANELIPALELMDAVGAGVIEMSQTYGVYYTGIIDVGNIHGALELMPYLLPQQNDGERILYFWGWKEILEEGFAEHNIKWMGPEQSGSQAFWSKYPIRSLDDLGGFKIRSFGYPAKILTDLGATAVFLPHEEVYTAIATGAIDGSQTSFDMYETNHYYEVCPYFYMPYQWHGDLGEYYVNMDAWNELGPELQGMLDYSLRAHGRYHHLATMDSAERMFTKFPEWGSEIITLPDSMIAEWRAAALAYFPELAAISPRMARAVKAMEDYMRFQGYIE